MKSLYHRKRLWCLCLAGVLNLTGLTACGKSAPNEAIRTIRSHMRRDLP